MSKTEILEELPKLTAEERREIRSTLNELDGISKTEWLDEGELTDEQKLMLEERLAACEKNPDDVIPWETVKAELKKRFGK